MTLNVMNGEAFRKVSTENRAHIHKHYILRAYISFLSYLFFSSMELVGN